jgi:hypothetical protein
MAYKNRWHGRLISVWHLDNSRDAGWAETPAAWPVGYTKVAEIAADDLEDAFRMTNSIDRPWWQVADVALMTGGRVGARSSSVGDVFEIEGVANRIASDGFEEVSGHAGIVHGRRP